MKRSIGLTLICMICLHWSSIAQTLNLNFNHDGIDRQSKVFLPDGYDDSNQYPLVLLMHGLGGNGSNMLSGSGFISVSNNADNPFIVVSPTATFQELFGATEWNEGLNPAHTVDDISYLNALLDSVISQYSIAEERIYSTGFSDGGFMTNRLACEMNDRIAAFASVGGTRAASINCDPDRGIPLFHIHGTGDDVVDYFGDFLIGNEFLAGLFISVDELMGSWVGANACVADIAPLGVGESTQAYYYTSCDDAIETWHYKVNDGQHDWQLTADFNTAEIIWEFFEQYTLPLGVQEQQELESMVIVYPNPTDEHLTITSERPIQSWVLLNSAGQQILSERSAGNTFQLREKLETGMYYLQLNLSEGQLVTKKVVVK